MYTFYVKLNAVLNNVNTNINNLIVSIFFENSWLFTDLNSTFVIL